MSAWSDLVLPALVDRVCGRDAIAEERARWVPRAHGRVLELGVGSGLNLGLYDPDRVDSVIGIDPSDALLARARPRLASARVPVELVPAPAEALPFEDGAFDCVVVTYTLCSVGDVAASLREARRVLDGAGDLLFIEHGLAPDAPTRRLQRLLTPAWRRVAGNCHLDRDVLAAMRAAGFSVAEHLQKASDGPRVLGFTTEGRAIPA